jgi:hypothetical protein
VLDGNRVGVWDWAIPEGQLWMSDSAYVLQGYAKNEIDGSLLMLDAVIHPDDRARPMQLLREAMRGEIDRFVSDHRIRTRTAS